MNLQTAQAIAIVVAALTGAFLVVRTVVVEKPQLFKFFCEDNGSPSSARLNIYAMCFTGCYIAIQTMQNIQWNTIVQVCALCGIGAVWKVAQKGKEENSPGFTPPQEEAK